MNDKDYQTKLASPQRKQGQVVPLLALRTGKKNAAERNIPQRGKRPFPWPIDSL
jgi:hypothetical protein